MHWFICCISMNQSHIALHAFLLAFVDMQQLHSYCAETERASSRVWRIGTGNSRYWEFFIFSVVSEPVSEKIGTGKKSRNRYRKNLVPEKSIGTGIGKIWYRKKVSEPVSVKFGIGKKYRNRYRKNLVPKKVPVSVSKIFGTGKKYRYRYRKKLVPEKSLGTGIGKIWYRKKVPEPVSEKFGTGKKYRYRYRKYLVPEKSIGTGIV